MGELPTLEGYYIDDILAYKKMQFENKHHFIQWLFPIPTVSFYNMLAPTLSKNEAQELGKREEFRAKMQESFRFVCKCYGLEIVEESNNVCVKPSPDFTGYWLTPNNHNHLRITRMLTCLTNVGLHDYAIALMKCLEQLCNERPGCVTGKSLKFWRDAVADI